MAYNYSEIVDYLLDWYDLNARILPWRENPLPYYVWVSEIMLQQTRVETVKSYFERFIKELPDIPALARVKEDKLLKLWEGLGYYNRVRNLNKAAITVMMDYNGVLPDSYEGLLKLPGIGAYTAGAIASIAYHIPVPAIDGNVLRVTKRIAGSFDDITKTSVKRELEVDLLKIIPTNRPGDFNQALMDLGAMICIPNGKPLCEKCPVMHLCVGFKNGTMERIPLKPKKKARRIEDKTILLIEYQDKIAIHQREKKGLLAGLWELPNLEGQLSILSIEAFLDNQINDTSISKKTKVSKESQKTKVSKLSTLANESTKNRFYVESLGKATHIFSHIEWRMIGYRIRLNELLVDKELVWVSKEEIDDKYAIPSAFESFLMMKR